MAMTEERPARRVARRVAAFGLPGSEEREPMRVAGERWPATLAELDREKLSGLAVAAREGGALLLDDRQASDLLERHREAMAWALGLERTLLRLAEAFEERGIGFVVLKGPALAHTIYPDPSWRPFGDLDLLVRTGDWRRACALLRDLGLRRRLPEPRPGFDERFGKAAVHRTPNGQEIDLHRTLAQGPFGLWIDPQALIDRAESFQIAHHILLRLDATATLLEASVHSILGSQAPPLLAIRDVAQSLTAGGIDRVTLTDWAETWHLSLVIDEALVELSRKLEMDSFINARFVARRATRLEKRVMDAYTTARRDRGGTAVATLHAIPSLRAKAAYLRAMMLPDRRFLSTRNPEGAPFPRIRRWALPGRWLVRRSSRG